jgi:hypothetical protein
VSALMDKKASARKGRRATVKEDRTRRAGKREGRREKACGDGSSNQCRKMEHGTGRPGPNVCTPLSLSLSHSHPSPCHPPATISPCVPTVSRGTDKERRAERQRETAREREEVTVGSLSSPRLIELHEIFSRTAEEILAMPGLVFT